MPTRGEPAWSHSALARLALAGGLCLAGAPARALDAVDAQPRTPVTDHALRVGSRTLRLPAGDWLFIGRRLSTIMYSPRRIDGVDAWVARLERGRFNLVIHLVLPTADGPGAHEWGADPCAQDVNILRQDLSRAMNLPECLAVVGHRDFSTAIAGYAPGVHRWLADSQLPATGPVVQFTYRERASNTFGAVSLFFAAECFPGDDDARQWAHALRDAFKPFFEGRQFDTELPPGPASEGTCHAPESDAAVAPAPG